MSDVASSATPLFDALMADAKARFWDGQPEGWTDPEDDGFYGVLSAAGDAIDALSDDEQFAVLGENKEAVLVHYTIQEIVTLLSRDNEADCAGALVAALLGQPAELEEATKTAFRAAVLNPDGHTMEGMWEWVVAELRKDEAIMREDKVREEAYEASVSHI